MNPIQLGIIIAVSLLALVVLLLILRIVFRKKQPVQQLVKPDLKIDLEELESKGPGQIWPQLQIYGIPVRLAVLVVAPKGQGSQIPNREQLQVLIDRITPGFKDVVAIHQPLIREWPPQMSVEGFSHAFFHNVQLPGDDGRGTPWSGTVGHLTAGMNSILLGMICVADDPNQLGQVIVKHEGQWREVLKVQQQTTA